MFASRESKAGSWAISKRRQDSVSVQTVGEVEERERRVLL